MRTVGSSDEDNDYEESRLLGNNVFLLSFFSFCWVVTEEKWDEEMKNEIILLDFVVGFGWQVAVEEGSGGFFFW